MGARVLRTTLTVIVDLMIVAAVALALRLIVMFFGQLAAQGWAQAIVVVTRYIVDPFGVVSIKTPYAGLFDANAAVTVVVLLVGEWVLTGVRERA
jgi:hypothetical protein